MKKFLLTLAVAALAATSMIAQTNTTGTIEEPDRVQMKALSKNPTGTDVPTGYDKPQTVAQKKHECKDHKDGQPCTKPADQQCPDCKEKAAKMKHECKEGQGKQCEKAAGQKCEKAAKMKHECKEGQGKQCEKAAGQKCEKAAKMKHECKEGQGKQCEKAAGKQCEKAAGKQCEKKAEMKKDCCKDMKDGKKCEKPADQQCPDCKEKAKKN